MLREIARELETALKAKACPLPVYFGPESTKTSTWARERIVLEHDTGAADSFGPARSQTKNPKHRMTRNCAAKVTIFAQAPAPGAQPFEHFRRAEHALDLVLVQLEAVILARKNAWTIKSGRFVQPDDLVKSEKAAGAVYELAFTVERAVVDRTWAGDKRPEATVGTDGVSIVSGDEIKTTNGPADQAAETAC
jgi:hypothetical protein